MAKRNRIMYASQSVRANGHLLYRVQTLGSNTTFTAEDVFELGHLDRIDVVDDVPAVAVALETNGWGDTDTMAVLAGMNPARMVGAPTASGAYLRTDIACTGSGSARYYHGVSLADFTLCNGVKIWAPVQNEAAFGTLDDDIQMSLFMDKVYVNSVTLTYNVGANATENYAAETDNKMWLVNNGKFISKEEWTIYAPANSQTLTLGLQVSDTIPALSNCKYAFLAWTETGQEGIIVKGAADRDGTVYPISTAAAAGVFGYTAGSQTITLPTDAATLFPATAKGYKFELTYAASAYATTSGDADKVYAKYFELVTTNTDPDSPLAHHAEDLGAIRQGQIEVYLVDPDLLSGKTNDDWEMQLRMQTMTITANPTRTAQNELGHARPFARSMNFPVEITTNTTVTAADLEKHAVIAGLTPADYEAGGNGVDLSLTHLMSKTNLVAVVKIFQQTDEEAGGTGMNRKAMIASMGSDEYFDWDGAGNYLSYDPDTSGHVGSCTSPPRERPLKTVIVPGLKLVAENFNNAVGGGRGGGAGATQEFNFRSVNKLFVVKGDVDIQDVPCIERNSAADQF
jgi:hypothetical protein